MSISFIDIERNEIQYRNQLFREWAETIAEVHDLNEGHVATGLRLEAAAFLGEEPSKEDAEIGKGLTWTDRFKRLVKILSMVIVPQPVHPQYLALAETAKIDPASFRWTFLPDQEWDEAAEGRARLVPASQFSRGEVSPKLGVAELIKAEDELRLAALYGILEREGQSDPEKERSWTDAAALAAAEFDRLGSRSNPLYQKVLTFIAPEGAARGDGVERVKAEDLAGVVDTLDRDGVDADTHYLKPRAVEALKSRSGSGETSSTPFGGGTRPSWIDISLPDLEAESDLDIISDNLKAMQAIYFASTLEDLKLFGVTDKLLELFNLGVLPFGKGTAGDKIYAYWKRNFDRFTEVERRNLYARALGKPGGEASQGTPNRQFNDLWLRFISSVSEWRRQFKVDRLLRADTPFVISEQQVQKTARDLASNLSLFGYGVAYFAATELQQQIEDIIDILDDDEVKASYGARDMWQVIDQVATLELGGARNSVRYRTMANAGAVIIRWLALNANSIARNSYDPLLSPEDLTPPRGKRPSPLQDPTTYDLIEACEQWLAVTGTPDLQIEEYAQPNIGPDYTSRPVQLPGAARDVFETVGFSPADFGLN